MGGLGEEYSEYEDYEMVEGYEATLQNSADINLENRGRPVLLFTMLRIREFHFFMLIRFLVKTQKFLFFPILSTDVFLTKQNIFLDH